MEGTIQTFSKLYRTGRLFRRVLGRPVLCTRPKAARNRVFLTMAYDVPVIRPIVNNVSNLTENVT